MFGYHVIILSIYLLTGYILDSLTHGKYLQIGRYTDIFRNRDPVNMSDIYLFIILTKKFNIKTKII